MSTRRPNVPRTGVPAATPVTAPAQDESSPVGPDADRPDTGADATAGRAGGFAGASRVDDRHDREHSGHEHSGRRRRLPSLPRRRARVEEEQAPSSTRFTVSRQDGRVSYAYTAGDPRPTARGATAVRPVPAKAFSGRLLAFALVIVTITILLAPTVRTYLGQRAEISSLQQGIEDEQNRKTYLEGQLARWNDPAYVKQQARDRLFYVMPGETGYLVIGADTSDDVPPVATSAESQTGPEPWLDSLWTSVRSSADDAATSRK